MSFVWTALLLISYPVFAVVEEEVKRPVNIAAVVTFVFFMILTLMITTWAARRTRSRKDYYAAGGDIGPIQNGFAIAGDTMSAASFLASFLESFFSPLTFLSFPFSTSMCA